MIGAGEIAISDERSGVPTAHELARIAHDVYTSGILCKKAGVIHLHVGGGTSRLELLRELIDKHNVKPGRLYPTHISRSRELLAEAVDLAKRGSFVDIDTVDEDLPKQLALYFELKGPGEKLTVSSDSSTTGPMNLLEQFRSCVLRGGIALEKVLALVTSNTAGVLKLPSQYKLR